MLFIYIILYIHNLILNWVETVTSYQNAKGAFQQCPLCPDSPDTQCPRERGTRAAPSSRKRKQRCCCSSSISPRDCCSSPQFRGQRKPERQEAARQSAQPFPAAFHFHHNKISPFHQAFRGRWKPGSEGETRALRTRVN